MRYREIQSGVILDGRIHRRVSALRSSETSYNGALRHPEFDPANFYQLTVKRENAALRHGNTIPILLASV